MHSFVSFNLSAVSASESFFSAISPAALYGKGVFTTIAIYGGTPFLWDKHWRRLTANAAKVGVDISEFSEEATLNALNEIIEKNAVADGRARITFFDESAGGLWSFDTGRKTSLLITTADIREVSDDFRLTVSPHRINTTSPLAGIKSCNYLEHLIAFEEAKASGFDEAVRLNERGEAASACMANIFWLKGGELYTPSLKTGCLAGTTREFVLENCGCEEAIEGLDGLKNADLIFLTSTGIGVIQVSDFDGRKLNKQPHEIQKLLPERN